MKIKIMTYQALETLKNNVKSEVSLYTDGNSDRLLKTLDEKPLVDTGISCAKLTLKVSSAQTDDFENVKKMYGTLKEVISPAMASDERLWAGMSMGSNCWQYINARWKKDRWNENTIKDHFYFAHGGRRSLTRNGLARLWWIGFLTYDSQGTDHWHYTKFACTYQRFIVDVLERNTGNSKKLIFSCINACEKYASDHGGKMVETNMMRDLQKYMSILGGTYLIDMIDQQDLEEKIYNKIVQLFDEKDKVLY